MLSGDANLALFPYFQLHNATPALAQIFEDLLLGMNRATGQYLATNANPFAQLMLEQRGVAPVEVNGLPVVGGKSSEPSNRGMSFQVNFISSETTIGGHTNDGQDHFTQPSNYPLVLFVAQDVDLDTADRTITINTYVQWDPAIGDKTGADMWNVPGYVYEEKGVKDWQSYYQLLVLHEIVHSYVKEAPGSTKFNGHLTPFADLVAGGAGGLTVSLINVQGDPVESLMFFLGRQFGLITDVDKYWQDRTLAYQQFLDELAKDLGFTTRDQLKALADKGVIKEALDRQQGMLTPFVEITPGKYAGFVASVIAKSALRIDVSDLAGAFGSVIGRMIAGSDPLAQIAVSATMGTVLENLGEIIERTGGVNLGDPAQGSIADILQSTGGELFQSLMSQGVGSLSSYLVGELAASVGIEGVVGELVVSAGSKAVSQIGMNLIANRAWNFGLGSGLITAVGSWVGAKLAMDLGNFETIGGQIGAAVGQAYGGINAAVMMMQNPWLLQNPVVAVIAIAAVVFFDTLLGGAIGTLLSGPPKSGADVVWSGEGQFTVGHSWSKNGAVADGAISLAESAAQILNAIVASSGAKIYDPEGVRAGKYGTHKKKVVYRTEIDSNDWATYSSKDAEDVINHGTYIALSDLVGRMVGGDIYIKRALLATVNQSSANIDAFETQSIFGNVSVAQDYTRYLANKHLIQALIAEEPQSAFSAGWLITLARAMELGLNKRASTDWAGGWNAFLDYTYGGMMDGEGFTPGAVTPGLDTATLGRFYKFLYIDGTLLGYLEDTIEAASKDRVVGTAANNAITIVGDTLQSTTGLTINGAAATTSTFKIPIAAVIDAGDGADVVKAGDLGNDVLGGLGDDTLIGGKLDDWLFGGDGADILFAGSVTNFTFASGNASGEAAALTADGGNGNLLDGGAGNDRLYGSKGSDWLRGGDGVDRLLGGDGGDILHGGAGNDQGALGEAVLLGGAGSDQYVFGFGDGQDVVLDVDTTVSVAAVDVHTRIQQIATGALAPNWAGGGDYELDGTVRGGEDAISFGPGVTLGHILLVRSGTAAAPGADLIIKLIQAAPDGSPMEDASGNPVLSGDQLTIKNWFTTAQKVEWLRFADGEEMRIGDLTTFTIGTGGSDVIIGTNQADFLYGGGGNDTIRGLAGGDFAVGASGNDFVAGDEDNDLVMGGTGRDHVIGGAGNDTVMGDAGNDRVYGGGGSDVISGGRGDDWIDTGDGDDLVIYQRGDGRDRLMDTVAGSSEVIWRNGQYVNGYADVNGKVVKDNIVYFDGTEWLGVYDYDDVTKEMRRQLDAATATTWSPTPNDTLEFGIGIDIQDLIFRRKDGNLEVAISDENAVTAFDDVADRITIRNEDAIEGWVFANVGRIDMTLWDVVAGGDGDQYLTSSASYAWMTGGGGDDRIKGDGILVGGAGNDLLITTDSGSSGGSILYGGAGDDVFQSAGDGDYLYGGAGVDIVDYTANNGAGRVYLDYSKYNSGSASGDKYDSIEGVNANGRVGGTMGDNIIAGGTGDNFLMGSGGDDVYRIGRDGGNDVIRDGIFVVDEVVDENGALNTSKYAITWTYLGYGPVKPGYSSTHRYTLTVRQVSTNEVVYQSALDGSDFSYTTTQASPPPADDWPISRDQWAISVQDLGTWQIKENIVAGEGGEDSLEFDVGLSLSDLYFSWSGSDLKITVDASNSITLADQTIAERRIEDLYFADGLAVDLTTLRQFWEGGTSEADFIVGDANGNVLEGDSGDDVLSGAAGADSLIGGEGNDVLEGGAGADLLDGGTDSANGGAAPDGVDAFGDTIRYVSSSAAVAIDLAAMTASGGDATGDTLVGAGGVSSIENVTGSDANGDTLSGDARANRLSGLGGADLLRGRAGSDVLDGGEGADLLYGDDGADALAGGGGQDSLWGGLGDDILSGGADADTLTGDDGDDRLLGDGGDDLLYGGVGADTLQGGEGADTLSGDAGNDLLAGGAGVDVLLGGVGDDTYAFDANAGADRITDTSGVNQIAITGVGLDRIWFSRIGNDLRVSVIGGTTQITVANYFAATSPSLVRQVILDGHALFLSAAAPLVTAMTSLSVATPTEMPRVIAEQLDTYWHAGGVARPTVSDKYLSTAVGAVLNGSVGAVDHDGDITGYSVVSVPTQGTISLNSATGAWVYTPPAGVTGGASFVLAVADAQGHTTEQKVYVNIGTQPAKPTFSTITPRLFEETTTATSIATLSTTLGAGADFVVTYDPLGWTTISGNLLSLKAGLLLDFETFAASEPAPYLTYADSDGDGKQEAVYTVKVRTLLDGVYSAESSSILIRIEDVAEPVYANKPVVREIATMFQEQASSQTTSLAALQAYSAGKTTTYSVISDPLGWLQIVGNELTLKAGLNLNFETLTAMPSGSYWTIEDSDADGCREVVYSVAVRSTVDGVVSQDSDTIRIRVEDINEAPTIAANQTFTVAETPYKKNDEYTGTQVLIGTVVFNDPDTDWSTDISTVLLENPQDPWHPFRLVNGNLYADGGIDFEKYQNYDLVVTVSDGQNTVSETIRINVTDVAEPIPSAPIATTLLRKTNEGTTTLTTVATLDSGMGASPATFAITSDPWGWFTVVGNEVRLRSGLNLDFETLKAKPSASYWSIQDSDNDGFEEVSYQVKVRSTVNGFNSPETTVYFSIEDVNEGTQTKPTYTLHTPIISEQKMPDDERSVYQGITVATLYSNRSGTVGYYVSQDPWELFGAGGGSPAAYGTLYLKSSYPDFELLAAKAPASYWTVEDSDADGLMEVAYQVRVATRVSGVFSTNSDPIWVRFEDVNEAPSVVAGQAFSIAENGAAAQVVGAVLVTDPDTQTSTRNHRFTLSGADASAFTIDNVTGQLKLVGPLDFESKQTYSVLVTATDRGGTGLSSTEVVTVYVTDVAEGNTRPTVTQTVFGRGEGATVDTVVATLASTQPGTGPTFALSSDPWSWFTISGTQLKLRAGLNLNFETLATSAAGSHWRIEDSDGDGKLEVAYAVKLRSTTGGVQSVESDAIWFRIEDVNEAPIVAARTFNVAENSMVGTSVGIASSTDADSQAYFQNHRYAITGADAAAFTIDALTGQIKVKGALNYEAKTSYTFQLVVTDLAGTGLSTTGAVTVNVTDVADTPTTGKPTFTQTAAMTGEGVTATTAVATLTSNQVFGDPTFSIVSDPWSWFSVTGDQLNLRSGLTLDFETLAASAPAAHWKLEDSDADGQMEVAYAATVRSTTEGIQSDVSDPLWFRIEDVNEAPTVSAQTYSVAEHSAYNATIGYIVYADPDTQAVNRNLKFSISGADAAAFGIGLSNGRLFVKNDLDFETKPTYQFQVTVTDQGGTGYSATTTITVSLSNITETITTAAPTFAQAATIRNEGTSATTTVATLTANQGLGVPTFAVSSDPWSWFVISGDQLNLKSGLNLNFETLAASTAGTHWKLEDSDADGLMEVAYSVKVKSTINGVQSVESAPIWYRVEDVNEAPTVSAQTFSVAENTATGTLIGSVVWADPDTQGGNRDPRFSLTGAGAANFTIDPYNGQLRVNGPLDFETATSYSFTVTVRDRAGAGLSTSAAITVNITDVAEAVTNSKPTFTQSQLRRDEGVTTQTTVATLTATQTGGTATFAVSSDPLGWFQIVGNQLVLKSGLTLNHETLAALTPATYWKIEDSDGDGIQEFAYSVKVRSTVAGVQSLDSDPIWYRVEDVNEAPWVTPATYTAQENAAAGTVIGTVTAGDTDIWANFQNLRYSLTGVDAANFAINTTTGVITVTGVLDYEMKTTYQFNVVATDLGGAGLAASQPFSVQLTDVSEPYKPTINVVNAIRSEGLTAQQWAGTAVSTLPGFSPTYTLSSDPLGWFTIMPLSGNGLIVLKANLDLDFETLAASTPATYWKLEDSDGDGLMEFAYAVKVRSTASGVTSPESNPLWFRIEDVDEGGQAPPVVIDLDGDGIELTAMHNSTVRFDMDGDGQRQRTGWVKSDDGLLALDRNGDGLITQLSEISFVQDLPGATSDLEGLRAFDSNGDGWFSSADERFASFVIWKDQDQDGVSDPGELASLRDRQVAAINLHSTLTGEAHTPYENTLYGLGAYQRTDGVMGAVGDVFLAYAGDDPTPPRAQDLGDLTPGRTNRAADDLSGPQGFGRSRTPPARQSFPVKIPSHAVPPQSEGRREAAADSAPGRSRQLSTDAPEAKRTRALPNYDMAMSGGASALNQGLDLAQRNRIKMIEAMASFSPGTAGELGRDSRLRDPKVMELLTTLPQVGGPGAI